VPSLESTATSIQEEVVPQVQEVVPTEETTMTTSALAVAPVAVPQETQIQTQTPPSTTENAENPTVVSPVAAKKTSRRRSTSGRANAKPRTRRTAKKQTDDVAAAPAVPEGVNP
jgi:hypothetical protein